MTYDVLYDLLPLDTLSSRFRGIGKYVGELFSALRRLTPAERQGLSIGALRGYGERATAPIDETELPDPQRPGVTARSWAWQRRTRLVGLLRAERPGLFHMTEPYGTPRATGVPRVVTCFDVLELVMHREYLGSWPAHQLALLKAYGRFRTARRIVSISRFTADDLIRVLGYPASRIDVVPLAADGDRFRLPSGDAERAAAAEVRARLGLSERPYLVYVGAPDRRKNVDTLTAAFARANVAELDLVLIGRYGKNEQAWVDGCVAAAGNHRGIRQLGYVADADIPAVYQGALGLSFASSYEGFGLPVLEAMLCGCPVITSKNTSLVEVAGDAALFVPPRDEAALTDAIVRLAREDSLRKHLSEEGLRHAATFSWKRTAEGTVDAYRRALAG
jgi:glycosyltransferase involved in cell wall biosynthesis